MKLTFLGATHEVTGSCYLLEACQKRVLIDYGMEQGEDIFENVEPCERFSKPFHPYACCRNQRMRRFDCRKREICSEIRNSRNFRLFLIEL